MVNGINSSLNLAIAREFNKNSARVSSSLKRIVTGSRFANPTDDPLNRNFVDRIDSQLRGVQQARLNVSKASGYVQQATSDLQSMEDIARSLRDLAIQAQDENLSSSDRELLQEEAAILKEQFEAISTNSSFDSTNLLDGTFGTKTVQNGPNAGNSFDFSIGDARAVNLGTIAISSGAQGSISAAIGGGSTALTLNGTSIGASTADGFSTSGANQSALAIANAINEYTSDTNVSAEVVSTSRTLYIDEVSTGSFTGNLEAGEFQINGVDILGTSIGDVGDLVTEINEVSETTGVSASVDANGDVSLFAEDGRNIQVVVANTATNNVYDVFNVSNNNSNDLFDSGIAVSTQLSSGSDAFATGAVRLYSSDQIIIGGGSSVSTTIGIASGTISEDAGTNFKTISLSSSDNADEALKILDSTIADISSLRADIGAVHDRLDISASSLLQSEANLDTVKTEVGGTDFAVEIANLAVAQFLQDANTAALAQANSSLEKVSELLEPLKDKS